MSEKRLLDFVRESNRIEGILREPTAEEVTATERFLTLMDLGVEALINLVAVYQPGAKLRASSGMNVRVGSHIAPPGGPEIERALQRLLSRANNGKDPWYTHIAYEDLHPFMDGNGRSGRAIWLWQMLHQVGHELPPLGFLHTFYYQTLERSRP